MTVSDSLKHLYSTLAMDLLPRVKEKVKSSAQSFQREHPNLHDFISGFVPAYPDYYLQNTVIPIELGAQSKFGPVFICTVAGAKYFVASFCFTQNPFASVALYGTVSFVQSTLIHGYNASKRQNV